MEFKILNGVKIYSPISKDELLEKALRNNKLLIAINAEKITTSNTQIKNIINKNIGYPDGVGAVWALRSVGINNSFKIPGCELWLDVIKKYYKSKTFYLIGGTQTVIEKVILNLKNDYPGIKILNYKNGYIKSEKSNKDLMNDIKSCAPEIIFVAIGSPSQEKMMEEMQKHHKATYVGLGGSFDIYIGDLKRAPKWWIKNNLEWAYRLLKQPTRIKRQIFLIPFLYKLLLRRL